VLDSSNDTLACWSNHLWCVWVLQIIMGWNLHGKCHVPGFQFLWIFYYDGLYGSSLWL